MASRLSWAVWTPTFPLLRERTVWLAACAARSAVAFGELVIGQYLATLSKAEHPMKTFDALFGLVAIALGRKAAAASILAEIRSLQQTPGDRHVAHADYFRMAYDDAIRVISEAASREQADDAEIRNLDGELSLGRRSPREQRYVPIPQAFPLLVDLWGFLYYPSWSRQRLRNTIARRPHCGVTSTFPDRTKPVSSVGRGFQTRENLRHALFNRECPTFCLETVN